ncbi:general transcription factor IIF subunit 2-like [Procambarus clarkii]|uniref:general transcription factor IIF subunit 2-like n=1 Tax=Procambarus clarkii TaxID=6728 RepID=UPI0037437C1C
MYTEIVVFPINQILLNTVFQVSDVPVTSVTVQTVTAPALQLVMIEVKVVEVTKPLMKKKAEGKTIRDDKDKVMELLFAAFEKHQYYNIKDLHKITRQPITYLKDILKDLCNYNVKYPHKNMWELKPEYRHYKLAEKAVENSVYD